MTLYNITAKNAPALLHYTFTLVEDKILLFGGEDATGPLNELYVFNLGTCCWTKPITQNNDQKPSPRRHHGAVYFESGNNVIFYAGERNKLIYDDMYVLNTGNYLWQVIKSKGYVASPRYGPLMVKVSKNICFIIGGYGGTNSETDAFDINETLMFDNSTSVLSEYTFRNISKDVSGPFLQGAYIEKDDTILVIGNNPTIINHLIIGEKECISKKLTGTIPTLITGYTLNALNDDKLIMFGGDVLSETWNDFYALYNGDDEWGYFLAAGKISDRAFQRTINYQNGMIIYGGRDGDYEYLTDMYFIDTSSKAELTVVPNQEEPHLRIQFSSVLMEKEKKIFIYGGNVLGKSISQGLIYDIETNKWIVQEIKFARPLCNHSAIYKEEDENILIFGGSNLENGYINKELYRINTKKWIYKEYKTIGAPKARIGHKAILYEDYMFIFCGFIPNDGYTSEIWRVNVSIPDPEWELIDIEATAKFIPNGRIGHSCTRVGKRAFLVGGNKHGITLDDVWIFNFIDYSWTQVFSNNGFNVPIYAHAAVKIDDYTIMITGGCNGVPPNGENSLGDVYFYKGRERKYKGLNWEWLIGKFGKPIKKRCYHEILKLENQIFILGGFEDFEIEKITLVKVEENAQRSDLMSVSNVIDETTLNKQSSLPFSSQGTLKKTTTLSEKSGSQKEKDLSDKKSDDGLLHDMETIKLNEINLETPKHKDSKKSAEGSIKSKDSSENFLKEKSSKSKSRRDSLKNKNSNGGSQPISNDTSKSRVASKKSVSGGGSDAGSSFAERKKKGVPEDKTKKEISELKSQMKDEKKKQSINEGKNFFSSILGGIGFANSSKKEEDSLKKKDPKKEEMERIKENRRASTKLEAERISQKAKADQLEREKVLFGYKEQDLEMEGIFLGGDFNYDEEIKEQDPNNQKETLKKKATSNFNDYEDDLLD